MSQLQIVDLWVSVEGKEILKGVNLTLNTGEFHVLMGPNGNGKSTLAMAVMGHYKYEITKGQILLDGEDVTKMAVDERSLKGLFLAMQYPSEIMGVTNSDFIKTAMSLRLPEGEHFALFKYIKNLSTATKELKMRDDLPHRYINVGFSGGEKKRNEILQMKMLKPKFAFLDEIDSGLDVDALKIVGENVMAMKNEHFGALIITHYERLLEYIKPDYAHVLIDGKIVVSGDRKLIERIDQEGYDWLKIELGLGIENSRTTTTLGTCKVAETMKKGTKK